MAEFRCIIQHFLNHSREYSSFLQELDRKERQCVAETAKKLEFSEDLRTEALDFCRKDAKKVAEIVEFESQSFVKVRFS